VQISKQRASRPALEETKGEVRTIAPASLPALGYLPLDTDLVAGIHVAEILAEPTAREFLTRMRLGPVDGDLSIIQKWTGLRLEDVDHAVLGLRVEGQLIPRFNLVVQTTRPYDAESLRKSMNVSRSPEPSKKELYRVRLEKSLLTPISWFADDHTLIVGLKPEDLAPVPAKPREGIDHLHADVVNLVKERLGQGTPAWIVGRAENWDLLWRILLDRQAREGQPVELFNAARTFGVWFQFNDGLALNAAVQCADAVSAKALEAYLTGHDLGDKKPFSMPAPPPELAPLYRELGQSLKSDRNDTWVVLQAKASGETMRKAFAPH
jgi:hypothetical protein